MRYAPSVNKIVHLAMCAWNRVVIDDVCDLLAAAVHGPVVAVKGYNSMESNEQT